MENESKPARGRRSVDCAVLTSLLICLTLAAACDGSRIEPVARIVLITLDTLRYDSFVGNVGGDASMPLTSQLVADCVSFTNSFAATSTTLPSHATLFTGLHPWQHGVTSNRRILPDGVTTIAERLRDSGYETVAVTSSYVLTRATGIGQGFNRYHEGADFRAVWESRADSLAIPAAAEYYSLAQATNEQAITAIDRTSGAQQFFWFHYFDAHEPYGDTGSGPSLHPADVKKAIVNESRDPGEVLHELRRLYRADVEYLDARLAAVLRRLREDEERVETHILLTADHGESLGEDGSVGHGTRLTPGQIRVPLVICSPALETAVRSDIAGSVDVAPTVLSLAGIRAQSGAGRDLTRSASDGGLAVGMRRTFDSPYEELRLDGLWHVIDSQIFYFVDNASNVLLGNGRQLDVDSKDGIDPQRRLQVLALFRSFEETLSAGGAPLNDDPETLEALRALGYLR
jgi:arylsulfatase A-like enzyme